MKDIVISGIQQIGVGIPNVHEAWKWYRENFGMDIKVFEEAALAEYMLPYTGNEPQSRHAILAVNLQGGGGFEIWQYTGRTPQPPDKPIVLGDLGIFAGKIKSKDVKATLYQFKENGLNIQSKSVATDPRGKEHFYVKDKYGNVFDIISETEWFKNENKLTGGAYGATIGCTDIEKSKAFYADILGYDNVLFEGQGKFDDLNALNGGDGSFKRAILTHSKKREGAFSKLFGPTEIELLQAVDREPAKIFEGRFWGDLGFIHLCYDIQGYNKLRTLCREKGYAFTVDSADRQQGNSFDMGEAAGHFAYIEDPDGTLIEFVETHKVPIAKKLGWYLNLTKRNPRKPLPNFIVKAMGMNRYKDKK